MVKQNPNDESASELIKKIENEKNELVKEGKISKLRKASPISDEEKAFRIPNNWKWVRLEEIAQLNTGTTPSIGKSRYEGNYIPFIKPGDISSKGINYNNFGLSKDGLKHGRLIDENSLLTVCIGGSTGKTYYTDRAISCNQQINASTPYKGVSVMFLFYEMLSNHFQEEIHQHASGSATPIINKTKFGNLCLPLPPLEEQKRIVTKIEKLMPLVDEYAESYNRLQKIDNEFEDKLKQSVLQYAMEGKLVKQNPSDEPASELIKKIENEKAELVKEGKIKKNKKLLAITDDEKQFDIPNGWEWVKLGNIVDYVQRGKSPKYDKESTRYPIISQKCVQWDGIHLEFAKHLKEDFWEGLPSYRFVTKGDLLLNSTGTGTVGRVIKVTEPFNKVPVDSHVTVIR
ncbi:restriction endonuclease subunit S, partial [Lactobacillus helveticus]|uniref:restriction endonuclease subunit S n=1 Tax=Lactobacillus helveticus TaxID=1587 RepID=UPI001562183F